MDESICHIKLQHRLSCIYLVIDLKVIDLKKQSVFVIFVLALPHNTTKTINPT